MIALQVITNGVGCWPDIDMSTVKEAKLVGIARLPIGTWHGLASVTFRLHGPDGEVIVAQTSLAALGAAVAALLACERGEL